MQVSEQAINVLMNSRVEGAHLFLPPTQLDRKLYEDVNKVLVALGGKWKGGKTKAHVFPECPDEALEAVLQTGKVASRKQEFQQFYTPSGLAKTLVELADVRPGMTVLEPSAGRGALIQAVLDRFPEGVLITAVELDPQNADHLSQAFPVTRVPVMDVFCRDFLTTEPYPRFDRVVMNPPFTRQQDIAHVRHAAKWLKPGGTLVSVMSASITFRTDQKTIEFHEWRRGLPYCSVIDLPPGAFRESGTDVNAVVLKLRVP